MSERDSENDNAGYMSQSSANVPQVRGVISAVSIHSKLHNKHGALIAQSGDETGVITRKSTMQKAGQDVLGEPKDHLSNGKASASLFRAKSRQFENPIEPGNGMVEEFKQGVDPR